jgi:hypothetical protein
MNGDILTLGFVATVAALGLAAQRGSKGKGPTAQDRKREDLIRESAVGAWVDMTYRISFTRPNGRKKTVVAEDFEHEAVGKGPIWHLLDMELCVQLDNEDGEVLLVPLESIKAKTQEEIKAAVETVVPLDSMPLAEKVEWFLDVEKKLLAFRS